jgi:nitric oxide dioxygenase
MVCTEMKAPVSVREALLWTLEQVLGEEFDPSVQSAWSVCYDELAGEMKAAAGL